MNPPLERTTAPPTVAIVPPGQGLALADFDVQVIVKASAESNLLMGIGEEG